jgi:predicted nucleic acid-binding protein
MTGPSFQFIDANLIMYSLGGPHPLQLPSKDILEKIKNGTFRVVSNTEVLQEILYRYFFIRKQALGELAYTAMIDLCETILPVTLQETDRALELLKQYPQITSRDTIHAATMLNNGIKEILSTDPHFDLIPGIRRIDPASSTAGAMKS